MPLFVHSPFLFVGQPEPTHVSGNLVLQAGLNHIHLLPLYDFGSVPEREEEQLRVEVSKMRQER